MLGTNPLLATFLPVADVNFTSPAPLAAGESVKQTTEPTWTETNKNLPAPAWQEAEKADEAATAAAEAKGDFGIDVDATPPGADILSPDYERTPLGAGIAPGGTPPAPAAVPPQKSADEAYQDTISQALKGNPPPPPVYDIASGPSPHTSKEFNQQPQLNPRTTFRGAQDEANADKAAMTVTENDAQVKRLKEISDWKAQQSTAALRYMDQLAEEKARNSHITSLFEDMSTPRKILTGLAVGLGTWVGAGMGAPTLAVQMLHKAMDQDLERKKFKAQQTLEEMRLAGARPEMIRNAAIQMQTEALATHQAALQQIGALADKALAPFPQARQAAKVLVADELAKKEINKRDFVASNLAQSVQNEGKKIQVTEGGTKASGGGDERVRESLQRGGLHEIEKDLDLLRKTGGLTDKEQIAMSKAARRMKAAEGEGPLVSELGHSVGLVKHDPIEVLPKNRRPIALAARRVELALANANARTSLTGEELDSARQQFRAPLGVTQADRMRHYQSLQNVAATPSETGLKAENRIRRAEAGPPKQLTTLQIARAPAKDAATYTKLKRALSPTPTEQNFVQAFEARYGR